MARKGNNPKPSFFGKIKEKIKEGFERIFKPKDQKQTKEPEQTETKAKHVLPPEPRNPLKQKQTAQQTPEPPQPQQPPQQLQQTVQPTRQSTPTPQQIKVRANEERKKYTPEPATPRPDNTSKDSSLWSTTIINNYKDALTTMPTGAKDLIGNWLNKMINEHGANAVATMLQDGAQNGLSLSYEIAYNRDKTMAYIAQMLNYLPEMTDWYKAEIMDEIDMGLWNEVE